MSDIPQVADCFGRGTHDAEPGELEKIVDAYISEARAAIHKALGVTASLCKLPWPSEVDVTATECKLRAALELLS